VHQQYSREANANFTKWIQRTERTSSLPIRHDERIVSERSMYTILRLRSQASLEELCEAFDEYIWSERLVLNEMAHRALAKAITTPAYRSSASEAGLRSRDPIEVHGGMDMERPFTPPDGDGGNVKVVVRVRKFIKRGTAKILSVEQNTPLTKWKIWKINRHV
jgi:hypothetical protein